MHSRLMSRGNSATAKVMCRLYVYGTSTFTETRGGVNVERIWYLRRVDKHLLLCLRFPPFTN